jgi:hypothetical protein
LFAAAAQVKLSTWQYTDEICALATNICSNSSQNVYSFWVLVCVRNTTNLSSRPDIPSMDGICWLFDTLSMLKYSA